MKIMDDILIAFVGGLILIFVLSLFQGKAHASKSEIWKCTAYCACKKCCGINAKGITASGKRVKVGMIACNWLPFGTKINIEGMGTYIVEDRGAKRYFGDKNNHIKHIDIYMDSHTEAKKFGVKYLNVEIMGE